MELGQILLSNNNWHRNEAEWATDGLLMLGQVIAESRGLDPNGFRTTLAENSGEEEFVNDVFEMRSYCWCDAGWDIDENENSNHPHAGGCPPNFLHKSTGLIFTWYKHAGRGITSNAKYPGAKKWFEILKECVESV